MAIAFLFAALAFSAFCLWLAVRVVNRRERWAKWTLAAIVALPVLYIASFGPACWITSRMKVGQDSVTIIYRPITRMFMRVPTWNGLRRESAILSDALKWFSDLGAADNWGWTAIVPDNGDRTPHGIIWTWTDYVPPPMENFRIIRISRTAPLDDSDDPDESTP
jgi:hypothetical protein